MSRLFASIPFFAFVTHFDHKGDTAQRASVGLLQAKVREIAGDHLAFIMGDFNLRPTSAHYQSLTAGTSGEKGFYDALKNA